MERLKELLHAPATGGILLLLMSILAVGIANSGWSEAYISFLHLMLGPLSVELWVNDVLMAIFFLGVGLEVKHEMLEGELNTHAKRFLPTIAALMGVLAPALVYAAFNYSDAELLRGWAIPTATDIAFSIGIISLVGTRAPLAAKVFLTTLAVVDDLIAVIIIAAVYTTTFNFAFMGGALAIFILLLIFNKKNVVSPWPYAILGIALWFCIFKSGLHATLAGVILAMTIPSRVWKGDKEILPLNQWHHALALWITFLIVPLFGFVNAGVSFGDFQSSDLFHPVVLGIALGLFLGKQIGIFGIMLVLVKSKLVKLPNQLTWTHMYGVALCCGVGFTMSLFVNLLALEPGHTQELAKVGIFLGSIVSGVLGYVVLRYVAPECEVIETDDFYE
ncbi:Na+/H+ antiporter NhaA [Veillonella intestinalis]|uniref:Na+/H+ antiporter NhaA n=1 Tax=Veillonella intestinalis TaxID=2941341 RepID=UPI002040F718|nr:Na+/H+ antiporter NhaA [Veillonella intestinalis]